MVGVRLGPGKVAPSGPEDVSPGSVDRDYVSIETTDLQVNPHRRGGGIADLLDPPVVFAEDFGIGGERIPEGPRLADVIWVAQICLWSRGSTSSRPRA